MKVQWLKATRCPTCHRSFGTYDVKVCVKCGTTIPFIPVVSDIPTGRYLMNFCTCPKLFSRDADGHIHLRLLEADTFNTINAGEEH